MKKNTTTKKSSEKKTLEKGLSSTQRTPEIKNVHGSRGDDPGMIDLQWDPVKGARGYYIEISPNHKVRSFFHADTVTKSRARLIELKPNTTYIFRVKVFGTANNAAWSEEVSCKSR